MNDSQSFWMWRDKPLMMEPVMPNGKAWPKISIVTPSFNQGRYIEETIRSVVMQGYPNLEYIVIDGGSSDETIDILRKYDSYLTYWVSEKDRGQTHAINKGFEKVTGDILAYLNSDDVYMPYTLRLVAETMSNWDSVKWVTGIRSHMNGWGALSTVKKAPRVYNQFLYSHGFNLSGYLGFNQQVSTFWRRDLLRGLTWNERLNCCMDIDLWLQLSRVTDLVHINAILGLMRVHPDQKSKTICNDLKEIESRYHEYGLYPAWVRKVLFMGMKTPVVRSILRRAWCDGMGRIVDWQIAGNWTIRRKSAY